MSTVGLAVAIARGVEATLRTAAFSEAVEVLRTYDVGRCLEEITAPRILVVSGGRAIEQFSRSETQRDYAVDVALQAPCRLTDLARGDALANLADQVIERLAGKPQAGLAWLRLVPKSPWAPEMLSKQGLWLSVHTCWYRTIA